MYRRYRINKPPKAAKITPNGFCSVEEEVGDDTVDGDPPPGVTLQMSFYVTAEEFEELDLDVDNNGHIIRIDDHASEDNMDQHLQEASDMVGNLRNMSVNMGTNIGQQNQLLNKMDKKFESGFTLGPMHLEEEKMSILLVFPKEDPQLQALKSAAQSLHCPCEVACRAETALELYLAGSHDVVIIDRRQTSSFDPDALCRSIRAAKCSQYSVVLAVVRASSLKADDSIAPLLKTGFNRCLIETTNHATCLNELMMIECNEFRSMIRLKAADSVFAALDYVSEAVEITNTNFQIQYVNHAYERLFGFACSEAIGKDARELHKSEKNSTDWADTVSSHLRKGKVWEGTLYARRKSGNQIPHHCSIMPVVGRTSKVRHFVSVKQPTSEFARYYMPSHRDTESTTGSFNGRRKESMARIHSMTIEAPITKVINIINAAQANSSTSVAKDLENVLEILYTTDLYSAAISRDKDQDQMTNDLIEGLLTNAKIISDRTEHQRRSSGSGPTLKQSHSSPTGQHILTEIPDEIMESLEGEDKWSYDILQLERVTAKRPLVYLAMKTFDRFGVGNFLRCSDDTLRNWLQVIEENYHINNPYHNCTHAADVMHSSAYFLEREKIKAIMEPIDEVSSLLAAVVHDVDHPGRTNPFLINSGNRLAVLYNDVAVLESHHVSLAFQLTKKDDRINIFKNMPREEFRMTRQYMIDMVLATEMAKHFEHLSKFVNNIAKPLMKSDASSDSPEGETDVAACSGDDVGTSTSGEGDSQTALDGAEYIQQMRTPENRTIIKRMLIKCSDVSNPTRPFGLCKEWAVRIAEEYFAQTDDEKERGLPVVMPVFDRHTCNIPKSQISFIDFFLKDMFDAWDAFCDCPELVEYLQTNYALWQAEIEKQVLVDKSQEKQEVSSDRKTSSEPSVTVSSSIATSSSN